uniref:Uncharacterized protein n=1 Tax=Eutreptiella gymnastica TaxID=73025 RepID=A0A7S1NQB0_9EUGL
MSRNNGLPPPTGTPQAGNRDFWAVWAVSSSTGEGIYRLCLEWGGGRGEGPGPGSEGQPLPRMLAETPLPSPTPHPDWCSPKEWPVCVDLASPHPPLVERLYPCQGIGNWKPMACSTSRMTRRHSSSW